MQEITWSHSRDSQTVILFQERKLYTIFIAQGQTKQDAFKFEINSNFISDESLNNEPLASGRKC